MKIRYQVVHTWEGYIGVKQTQNDTVAKPYEVRLVGTEFASRYRFKYSSILFH